MNVSDEGVRAYLEDAHASSNPAVVVAQLNYAKTCLDGDVQDQRVGFKTLEAREAAYENACYCFGHRLWRGVQDSLRDFWRV